MLQRVLITLLTVLVFAAGFGARLWMEGQLPLPPPPGPLMSEFGRPPPAPESKNAPKPIDRAKLVADIERLRPQIDAFRARMEQIDTEFETDLVPLLTPDQRERLTGLQKKRAERNAKGEAAAAADSTPLSDEQIYRLQQHTLFGALSMVALSIKLDAVTRDLKLEDGQLPKVRELLQTRREKFLVLVDSTPPPSITLSQLAPVVQKLAGPKK